VAPLAYVGAGGVRGIAALRANAPGYGWPILGKAIAARAPRDRWFSRNFVFDPIRSSALRFYADRRTLVATSLPAFEERMGKEAPAIFVRDLNAPMEAALGWIRLRAFPSEDVAMFRIHDPSPTDRGRDDGGGGPHRARCRLMRSSPAARLTGYAVTPTPRALPSADDHGEVTSASPCDAVSSAAGRARQLLLER